MISAHSESVGIPRTPLKHTDSPCGVLTPRAGSLCVQLTATLSFQSVSPSSWSVLIKQEPREQKRNNPESQVLKNKNHTAQLDLKTIPLQSPVNKKL